MINFQYVRASSVADAVNLIADNPSANSLPAGPT